MGLIPHHQLHPGALGNRQKAQRAALADDGQGRAALRLESQAAGAGSVQAYLPDRVPAGLGTGKAYRSGERRRSLLGTVRGRMDVSVPCDWKTALKLPIYSFSSGESLRLAQRSEGEGEGKAWRMRRVR